MNKLLYGVAYYYEYLPYDRLDEDIKMMKAAVAHQVHGSFSLTINGFILFIFLYCKILSQELSLFLS